MGKAEEGIAALLKAACLPLAGNTLAGEISKFFDGWAKTGLLAAIGATFTGPGTAIVLAYAAIFGVSAWVANEDDKKKATELSSLFRSLEKRLLKIETTLNSSVSAGEIAATLNLFEQQEIGKCSSRCTPRFGRGNLHSIRPEVGGTVRGLSGSFQCRPVLSKATRKGVKVSL